MRIRTILFGTAALVSATGLHASAAGICSDDRYLCEPKPQPTVEEAAPPQPLSIAPQPASASLAKRPTHAKVAGHPVTHPKSAAAKPEIRHPGWNILTGTPTLAPKPKVNVVGVDEVNEIDLAADNAKAAAPAGVRVVFPDEFNEIDRLAPPPSLPLPQQRSQANDEIPAAFAASETAGLGAHEADPAPTPEEVVSAAPDPSPARDTALFERVLITFGAAFAAASALRIFAGETIA